MNTNSKTIFSGDLKWVALLFFLFSCAGMIQVSAQCNVESGKLISLTPDTDDNFGRSIAVSGDYAVVGVYRDDNENGEDAGSAFILEKAGGSWSVIQEIKAPDGSPNAQFGFSVGISGETAMVAAPSANGALPATGAVYVFEKTGPGWTFAQKLTASDAAPGTQFGSAISMDGSRAVIGAQGDFVFAGAVYIFADEGAGWTEQAKLTASDRFFIDLFGSAANILGSQVIVGAPLDDNSNGQNAGSVYVFEETAPGVWTEFDRIQPAGGGASDFFGASLANSGSQIFCGAPLDNIGAAIDGGSVTYFEKGVSEFIEMGQLTNPNGVNQDGFGTSMAFSSGRLVIGAPGVAVGGIRSGAAYTFGYIDDLWTQIDELNSQDLEVQEAFGTSVAISGIDVLVGAPFDNEPGNLNAGSVYTFALNRAPKVSAGPDQTVFVTDPATLDGSSSADPDDDPIAFTWAIELQPNGSAATLDDPNAPVTSLTPDVGGTYIVSLTVSDGCVESEADQVAITAITVQMAIDDLISMIDQLEADGFITHGRSQSATNMLIIALREYNKGKIAGACHKLEQFIDIILGLVADGDITAQQASDILDPTYALSDHFGCDIDPGGNGNDRLGIANRYAGATLGSSYPNPAGNSRIYLPFAIPVDGQVTLEMTSIDGRFSKTILDGSLTAGEHTVDLDAIALPNGLYIYRMTFGEWSDARLILIQR